MIHFHEPVRGGRRLNFLFETKIEKASECLDSNKANIKFVFVFLHFAPALDRKNISKVALLKIDISVIYCTGEVDYCSMWPVAS